MGPECYAVSAQLRYGDTIGTLNTNLVLAPDTLGTNSDVP